MCTCDVAAGMESVRRVSQDMCRNTESPRLMRSYGDFDDSNPRPVTRRARVSVHSCKMTGAVIMFEEHSHTSACIGALIYTWVLHKLVITALGGARVELYVQEYSRGVHWLCTRTHTAS